MSKNIKQFPMEKKEDYLFVLQGLYINIYRNVEQYKRYKEEALSIYSQYVDIKDEKVIAAGNIPRCVYEDINNKIQNVSKNLILYTADDSADSMSYRMFRRIFNKHNKFDLKLEDDKDLDTQLQELLNLRNWMFHNPQSVLVANKEVFDKERERQEQEYLKNFPEEVRKFLKPSFDYSLINIQYENEYEPNYLLSLYVHSDGRISIFEKILEKMKKDYTFILGKEVKVTETVLRNPMRLAGDKLAIANLSMAIQKKQYKGNDDKKYDEITLKQARYENLED